MRHRLAPPAYLPAFAASVPALTEPGPAPAGNDDEVTAPLQIASFNGKYPYPEDFDGSTQIGEQVAYWQSHSGDIGGVDPV